MLSMIPSVAEISGAVRGILRYFGWRNLAILTGPGEDGRRATEAIRDGVKSDHHQGFRTLFHRQFNSKDLNGLQRILKTLSEADVTAIFLHCDRTEVEMVFTMAREANLLTGDRVWLVTEDVIEACSAGAPSCPSGLIGLRLRRSCEPGLDKRSTFIRDLVYDNVMVYAEALGAFLKQKKPLGSPPSSCEDRALPGGNELFK